MPQFMQGSGVMTASDNSRPQTARRALGRAARRALGRGLLRAFLGERKGSTAIEFTILAIPFSLLVFAILESCIAFGAQQLLTNATDDLARQIRTGQIKQSEVKADPSLVRDRICKSISILVAETCPGLSVDLRAFDTFEEAAAIRTKFTEDHDIDDSQFKVDPGQSLSKNMLRVFYRWPVMTDFMRKSMSNLKGGKTLLFATATWQNEPFDD